MRIYPHIENLTDKDIKRKRPVCPDCGKKHAGPVCPCNWCGWIHPGMSCPSRPYTPVPEFPEDEVYPTEEDTRGVLCWHCGKREHYALTCEGKLKAQSQPQPEFDTEGPLDLSASVKKSPKFSMKEQLIPKDPQGHIEKVPISEGRARVVDGHLIRPKEPQTEIQKAHPTLSLLLSKKVPHVKPVEVYLPKGSSSSTRVVRGAEQGSSSGTGGQPPIERSTVPTRDTSASGTGGAPGDNPHLMGLLEEGTVEVVMMIGMKVMMGMKIQRRFQKVVKLKRVAAPPDPGAGGGGGHHHPHPQMEGQHRVNNPGDLGDIEAIEVKEVTEVGQDPEVKVDIGEIREIREIKEIKGIKGIRVIKVIEECKDPLAPLQIL